ncbi:hypothetical protein C440_09943 [Haloferax mucosum ATCC BAA-1512]|uniref:Uncharacterized protein n=1 Tax=Haloferax mucosum ATCC BAA-1512 TaxID=662479 RepID=M0ICL8_9EURY|nr:hypothetical protein C440_09943 [Haloferax mucosum ATCC BAA-1512]
MRQGAALWAFVALGWRLIPADHPAQIAVVFSGLYGAVLLPTAIYFDFRERTSSSQPVQSSRPPQSAQMPESEQIPESKQMSSPEQTSTTPVLDGVESLNQYLSCDERSAGGLCWYDC